VNADPIGALKEAFLVYFYVLNGYLPVGKRANKKPEISHGSRPPNQETNPEIPV
jgi:hypothetical protein